MPTLSIKTPWTYDGWECIFKYECRWYMSGEWTIIKVNPYWYVTLINDNSLDNRFGGDRFEDDEYDESYSEDTEDDNEETWVKRIKIDETILQKIKKIIDDNIQALSTMWWLEPEPPVYDWCYSRIFIWWEEISIQAEISNLWSYNLEWQEQPNESCFFVRSGMQDEEIPRNITRLMNVFFRIRDILVENWIDEEYFSY